MKHIKKILTVISLTSAAVVCFAACGKKENIPPEHEHTFAETWQHDEQKHWHEATCEHTWLHGSEAAHTFTDDREGEETCTEGVEVTRTCVCGYSYTYTTDPLGHDYQPESTDPTCETPGESYLKCTRCGDIIDKKEIPAVDHNYHYEIVTDEEGNDVGHHQVCGFCGEEKPGSNAAHAYTGEYRSDATSHWQLCVCGKPNPEKEEHTTAKNLYGKDEAQHWLVCDVCGAIVGEKEDHNYDPETGYCECGDLHVEKDYFTWESTSDGYTVTGMIADLGEKTSFTVPAVHEGKAVTAIAAGAFRGNTVITKLILPESIKTIGDFAFENCTALEEINLPENLEKLGTFDYQVFNGCSSLQSIELPAKITSIGGNMFKNCTQLAEVTFNGQITKIDTQAFYGCAALETIPATGALTYVGQMAFAKSGLTEVTLTMANNGRIAGGAFTDCVSLATVSITGGIQYFASPIFEGCKALATLTLPFVGADANPSHAITTVFGYVFGTKAPASADTALYTATEQGGVTYYIPKTLTSVTVDGGTVKRGAFENCGAISVHATEKATCETNTFTGYTGTFTWDKGFTAPTLTASVDKPQILVNETVTLTYNCPSEYATVTVTVKKGDAEAQLTTDYTVQDKETGKKEYTFKTAGDYTIEVVATENGVSTTQSLSVKVELPGPNFTKIEVAGDTYKDGVCEVSKELTLTFTYEGDTETTFTYVIKKGGETATPTTDYTLVEAEKKITFNSFGAYTIEVTATRNKKTQTLSVSITVLDPKATPPEITEFKAEKTEGLVEGDAGTALTTQATFKGQDETLFSKTYEVFIQEGGSSYNNADTSYYTFEGDTFKALVAGNYKITVTVIGTAGGKATSDVTLTVAAVDLTEKLSVAASQKTNGWVRVATGSAQEIAYTLTAGTYVGGYEVSATATNGATASAVEGAKVSVSSEAANTSTITVTYTHKKIAEKTYTLEIPVSFVTDVDSAPVLGEDPFGGTYGELLTATGLQLYWNVTDKATEGTQLALADVTFAVVDGTNTTGQTVGVYHVVGNETLPWYVIVEDWSAGTATGEVAVKLTATKGGQTAAATKLFTVNALPNPGSSSGLNAYADKVMGTNRGAMNFDEITSRGHRENMVISKEGIYEHRTGGDWTPNQDNAGLIVVTVNGGNGRTAFPNDFQLDFEYQITKRTGNNTKASFCVNYRTGAWGGYNGSQTAFYAENQNTTIDCASWNGYDDGSQGWEGEAGKPNGAELTHIHIRLTHTVSGGKAHFTWTWSSDGTTYNAWYSYTATVSAEQGNMGSPIYALQINNEQGSYYLGNFKLTDLTAE